MYNAIYASNTRAYFYIRSFTFFPSFIQTDNTYISLVITCTSLWVVTNADIYVKKLKTQVNPNPYIST